ncbi:hypothetical protein D9M71_193050 [compost metagenome]
MPDRIHWRTHIDDPRRRPQGNRAAVGDIRTEDQTQQFSAPRADQTGNPENLSGTDFERHVANLVGPAQALDRQHRSADLARPHIDMFAELAADHQRDQLLAVVVGHRLDTDQVAVAQHGNALRDSRQLFEAMGDVDDRYAASLQAGDLLEQHFDFAGSEHRGRLVENQHMTIANQVARDLHHLLVADAQLADQGVRVNGV